MGSEVTRVRLGLAYDGTHFIGWQKQPNDKQSIQGLLEGILGKIYNQKISVVGSGRTDRGVHALKQWAHCDLPDDDRLKDLSYKLNRMAPEHLAIHQVLKAPQDFHAQISAVSKCYKYRVLTRTPASPFQKRFAWALKDPIDLSYLNELAALFLGEHDFTSFQSAGTPVSSPVRKILISRWVELRPCVFEYQIQGTGFLKQMVRNMVGTMIKLQQFQAPAEELSQLLGARDRSLTAAPAPPQGLFLSSVQYPPSLDNKCRKL